MHSMWDINRIYHYSAIILNGNINSCTVALALLQDLYIVFALSQSHYICLLTNSQNVFMATLTALLQGMSLTLSQARSSVPSPL